MLPGHEHSTATAVSDDGTIVVGFSSTGEFDNAGIGRELRFDVNASRAFYWTEEAGMQDLGQLLSDAGVDMTGVTAIGAHAMTPGGDWISVVATTPDGEPGEAVSALATLVPEPAAGRSRSAALVSLTGLEAHRRRRVGRGAGTSRRAETGRGEPRPPDRARGGLRPSDSFGL